MGDYLREELMPWLSSGGSSGRGVAPSWESYYPKKEKTTDAEKKILDQMMGELLSQILRKQSGFDFYGAFPQLDPNSVQTTHPSPTPTPIPPTPTPVPTPFGRRPDINDEDLFNP